MTNIPDTKSTLVELVEKVDKGLETFLEVGAALLEIRDRKLYKDTFEALCQEHWSMGRRHANRLIASTRLVEVLGPVGPIPSSEWQVRPLHRLRADPGALVEAWEDAHRSRHRLEFVTHPPGGRMAGVEGGVL